MSISAAQVRAARALKNWTQDELALNAQVARATIVEFEKFDRVPVINNLASIQAALEVAGIEFIDENGGGVGVRFRKQELEYSKTVKIDADGLTLRMRFCGDNYWVRVPREVINDLNQDCGSTPEEFKLGVEKHLHHILKAAENALRAGHIIDGKHVVLDHSKFPDEVFR